MNLLDAFLNGELQWRNATWLWALLFPLILGLIKHLITTKQQQNYADAHLWPWVSVSVTTTQPVKKNLPPLKVPVATLFMTLAWCSLILALAGPRSLIHSPNTASRDGVDILVSMDLSHSMTATDRYPNRFLFAKSLVESMSKQLEPSDRLALQAFAGQPHIVSPLSEDRALFQHFLNLLEPDLLPLQGSWIERAILEGAEHLRQTGGESRLLVLFTNGAADFWKTPLLPESLSQNTFFQDQDNPIQLLIVGVGLPSASTLNDPLDANKIWRVNGQIVQSRLEENRLKKLAQHYGGHYLRADSSQAFMQQLLQTIALPAGKRPPKQDRAIWQDYAHPLIVIGFVLLLMAFYLFGLFSVFFQSLRHRRSSHYSVLWLTGVLAVSLYSVPQTATANALPSSDIALLKQADHAYQNEQHEKAYQLYTQVSRFQGMLGAGDAAYQLGNIETAIFYFRQAAWQATQDSDRAKALFNLGNSYYQVALFEYAIQSYQQALLYQPNDKKAQHNLALAQQAKASQPPTNKRKGAGKGEGEGKQGAQGEESEGAFYGGQKPSQSDHSEQGFGSDGDAPEGSKQGNQVTLSKQTQSTQYQLNPSTRNLSLNASNNRTNQPATLILEQQQKQQRAERFKQQIQQLEDNQKALLQRLFEREAGFHAPQERAHPIPGVQPW